MAATNYDRDYIAALVQLQRAGVAMLNGYRIEELIALERERQRKQEERVQ